MTENSDADTPKVVTSVAGAPDDVAPLNVPTSDSSASQGNTTRRRRNSTVSTAAAVSLPGTVSDGAKAKIEEVVQSYADELGKKLCTVEKEGRDPRVKQAEFTASTVIKADEELRRNTPRSRGGKLNVALGVTAPVSSGVVGTFSNYLHSAWQTGIFGAAVAIAIVSTFALVYRAR